MLSKIKGVFKRNAKAITVSMTIAIMSILSSISCFATDGTSTSVDINSILESSIGDLKTELLQSLAIIIPVAFAILMGYLAAKKAFAWIKGLVGRA